MAAHPKLNTAQREKVADAYAAGATAAELGEKYNVSASTILNVVRAAGVTVRPRGRQSVAA